jgi:hypothetical protein
MQNWFAVEQLDVQRLLADWRWLCPESMTLVARNAFANLFLRDNSGTIFLLDVAVGTLTKVADSEAQFRELAATSEKRERWFAETDEQVAAKRGLTPSAAQCIGFSAPLVFSESGHPDNPYVADLYEHVAFLGDLNRQIAELPDGAQVRLQMEPEFPEATYLQTDDFENWKRKLQGMSEKELQQIQKRLEYSIDRQAATGGDKKRLEHMLEICNIQIALVSLPKPVERVLLVNAEGNPPWTTSPLNTLSVEAEIGMVRCKDCPKVFKIYCDDDIPADELETLKQHAETEALNQLTDQHASLAGHRSSIQIQVRYLAPKKQS